MCIRQLESPIPAVTSETGESPVKNEPATHSLQFNKGRSRGELWTVGS